MTLPKDASSETYEPDLTRPSDTQQNLADGLLAAASAVSSSVSEVQTPAFTPVYIPTIIYTDGSIPPHKGPQTTQTGPRGPRVGRDWN